MWHDQDMRKCGHTLAEILKAGQWRSAAFMSYLNEADLERASRAAQLHVLSHSESLMWQDVALAAAIESDEEVWID